MPRQGRNAVAAMLVASALTVAGVTAAQEPPPNLRMLLNLDLFAPRASNTPGTQAPGSDDSMVEQIRTLNALGYLHTKRIDPTAAEPENTVVKDSPEADQRDRGENP